MRLIELAGTSKSLRQLKNSEPLFCLVITGPTKSNQKSGAGFSLLCVVVTGGTHIQPGWWVKLLVMEIHNIGKKSGR